MYGIKAHKTNKRKGLHWNLPSWQRGIQSLLCGLRCSSCEQTRHKPEKNRSRQKKSKARQSSVRIKRLLSNPTVNTTTSWVDPQQLLKPKILCKRKHRIGAFFVKFRVCAQFQQNPYLVTPGLRLWFLPSSAASTSSKCQPHHSKSERHRNP